MLSSLFPGCPHILLHLICVAHPDTQRLHKCLLQSAQRLFQLQKAPAQQQDKLQQAIQQIQQQPDDPGAAQCDSGCQPGKRAAPLSSALVLIFDLSLISVTVGNVLCMAETFLIHSNSSLLLIRRLAGLYQR